MCLIEEIAWKFHNRVRMSEEVAKHQHYTRHMCGFRGEGVVMSFGFVLSRWAPLRMYLFGTAKGHNRPRRVRTVCAVRARSVI